MPNVEVYPLGGNFAFDLTFKNFIQHFICSPLIVDFELSSDKHGKHYVDVTVLSVNAPQQACFSTFSFNPVQVETTLRNARKRGCRPVGLVSMNSWNEATTLQPYLMLEIFFPRWTVNRTAHHPTHGTN